MFYRHNPEFFPDQKALSITDGVNKGLELPPELIPDSKAVFTTTLLECKGGGTTETSEKRDYMRLPQSEAIVEIGWWCSTSVILF